LIQVESFAHKLPQIRVLTAKFQDRRVDFADACLMLLAEEKPGLKIITADVADFSVFFRGRKSRLIMPGIS
jgi:predicted nucleic acid-binding protein